MADSKISALTDGGGLLAADEIAVNRAGASRKARAAGVDGWVDDTAETWTYASADAPTFTFTIAADVTAKYAVGQRIKLTQTTVKYFIITAVSTFSGGNTTITVYGGTDYTLANAAISANYHSTAKAPFGFPLDPTKWTVEATSTSDIVLHTNPVASTWYNGTSISIPIGCWRVVYQVTCEVARSGGAGVTSAYVTLSTANNSESDKALSGIAYAASALTTFIAYILREKVLNLSSKTSYFLNGMVDTTIGASGTIEFRGDLQTTVIRAICAYL